MTPEESALAVCKIVLATAEDYRPSPYVPWRECDYLDLAKPIAAAIEGAVKETTESLNTECDNLGGQISDLEENLHIASAESSELLAIARELAAKCLRGQNACTACGAVAYMGALTHNAGCAVTRLEAFK